MIRGRPTTRALSARILVGIGVGISVGFFAGPTSAASALVVPTSARAPQVRLKLAWLRSFPGLSTPLVDESSRTSGSTPDERARPEGPAGAEAPAAVSPREAASPPTVSPPVPIPPPSVPPPPGAPPEVSFSDVVAEVPDSVPPPRRPRFEVAVGMGGSFDGSGLVKDRTVLAPSFWLQGGIGDGPLGFEARMLSTQASGRFHQMCNGVTDAPVDRLAVDILFALRPFAADGGQDSRWIARFARSWALNIGASGENGSVAAQSAFRIGVVVGSHVDLPISPASDNTELRVRLGVRRMLGGQGAAGAVTVSDTVADVFGGLAVVF